MDGKANTTRLQHAVYLVARTICAFGLRAIYRAKAYHAERMPMTGSLLIAANHQSYLDPPLIGIFVKRKLNYLARSGLFRSRVFGWIITACNALPISEEGGDLGAIRETIRRLEEGRAILIFPEGSRSSDGAMRPLKRGIALLMKKAGCPVMPVAVEGCFDAWPRDKRPRLMGPRIAVMYGEPIPREELKKLGADAALERIEREIEAMRLVLREKLRAESDGRYPRPGPGDRAMKPDPAA